MAPDLSAVCDYEWTRTESFWRGTGGLEKIPWQPPPGGVFRRIETFVGTLPQGCGDPGIAQRDEARLTAYYAEHLYFGQKLAAYLPRVALSLYTLGFMPLPDTRYFAACLQVVTARGSGRNGLVRGQVNYFANVWGMGDNRFHRGKQKEAEQIEQLLRDLTVQAWHKLWQLPDGDANLITRCPDALDAMME